MPDTVGPAAGGMADPAQADRTLAMLNAQADEVRAELKRLRLDLTQVQQEFGSEKALQLLEANEQLVLAALHADTIAETAVSHLDQLARTSQRDVLTDTPNRALMHDRLTSAIAMARRRETRMAVIFVDLDHFKQVNDTLGHAAGDLVLQMAAQRLGWVVRDSDSVSRHGGDEFLVLLSSVALASDAAVVAEKMLLTLAEPSTVAGRVLRLSASLGISIYPEDGTDADTLVGRADAAMYQAKQGGRGRFAFYADIPAAGGSAGPLQPAGAGGHLTLIDDEPRLRDLREANEKLVMAALDAQEMVSRSASAHALQIKFLAMVAHELRNPLNPIRTAVDLLHRARTDEALLLRLQANLQRQVGNMSGLIDDLLDGSRVGTGQFRLERREVDLIGVLRLAVETCQPNIDKRLQQLTLQWPPHAVHVLGDTGRLAQVFGNLLGNASKYTPKGGRIAIEVTTHGATAKVAVSDSGMGIAPEVLPHVFDLFVQDARVVSHQGGGLGIGLAVVRDLVAAHGGTVEGCSAGPDLGSVFVVSLPVIPADRPL